jgi:hypothetical protein
MSEFENFLLCERILVNVTICQNERTFMGLVEQKNVVFNSFLCKLAFFLALIGFQNFRFTRVLN